MSTPEKGALYTRAAHPVLITDAEPSQREQLHRRQIRYAIMMGLRIACLVAATVLVGAHAPLLWLWLPACLAGMIVLPWMAVLIANDRPPRTPSVTTRIRRRHPSLPGGAGGLAIDAATVIDGPPPNDMST